MFLSIAPPAGMLPQEYFERWLIDSYNNDPASVEIQSWADYTLQFVLSGEKGGSWNLRYDQGFLTVRRGVFPGGADLTLSMSCEDWLSVFSGRTVLPVVFEDSKQMVERLRELSDLSATFVIHLEGEGGGFWSVCVEGGQIHVNREPVKDPDILVQLSVEDWRRMIAGDIPAPEDFKDPLHVLEFKNDFEDMTASMELELTGDNGGLWCLVLQEGRLHVHRKGLENPDIKIVMPTEVWASINQGDTSPAQAFLEGRLRMAGDLELALRFASVFPGAFGGDFIEQFT